MSKISATEKAGYVRGLRDAIAFCDIAEAGFKSGGHLESAKAAKLCSEAIRGVIDRECTHVWRIDGMHSNEFCEKCFVSKAK